jgi:ferric-dicitrate binding protein FerR (iron transport regulator)
MNHEEIEEAIQASFDGSLSPEQCQELRAILKTDVSARALYYQHADLHQSLVFRMSRLSPFDSAKSVADVRLHVQRRRMVQWSITAAVAALLVVGLVLKFTIASSHTLATFRTASGALYTVEHSGGVSQAEGELGQQSVVHLSQGSLEISLRNGIRSIILAPARVELRSEMEMIVHQGTAWCRVSEDGKGFRMVTKDFVATDLGTEFGVLVGAPAGDEVHVFSGSVEVATNDGKKQVLTAGEASRWSHKEKLEAISAKPGKFLSRLPVDPGANFIVNGTFEFGAQPDDSNFGVFATASLLPGWKFGRDVAVANRSANGAPGLGSGWGNVVSPTEDIQVSFRNSRPPYEVGTIDDSLWQTFMTEPGKQYEVSFDMGGYFGNKSAGDVSIVAAVYEGDATSGTALAHKTSRRVGNYNGNKGYNPRVKFLFTAKSTRSTLVLTETSANSDNASPVLDNVAVRERTDGTPGVENSGKE